LQIKFIIIHSQLVKKTLTICGNLLQHYSAYNNAYQIMQYTAKNVNVRPHHVNHCVRTFGAFLKNNLYSFFERCASSSDFYIHLL